MKIVVDLDRREDRKDFEQFMESKYGDGLFSGEVKGSRVSKVIDKVKNTQRTSQKSTKEYFKDNPKKAVYDMMGEMSTVQDIVNIVYGDSYSKNDRAAVYRAFEGLLKKDKVEKLNTKNGQPNVYRRV